MKIEPFLGWSTVRIGATFLTCAALASLVFSHRGAETTLAPQRFISTEIVDSGRQSEGSDAAPDTATSLEQLRAMLGQGSGSFSWDMIEGLRAVLEQRTSHVEGQPTLRLVADSSGGRHAVAIKFGPFQADQNYRVTGWVKAPARTRIMLEARDSNASGTGKPVRYGMARFDVSSGTLVNREGDIHNPAMVADDGWQKISAEIRSSDGAVFVLIGLLEGENNRHIFKGSSEFEVTIGGVAVTPAGP